MAFFVFMRVSKYTDTLHNIAASDVLLLPTALKLLSALTNQWEFYYHGLGLSLAQYLQWLTFTKFAL